MITLFLPPLKTLLFSHRFGQFSDVFWRFCRFSIFPFSHGNGIVSNLPYSHILHVDALSRAYLFSILNTMNWGQHNLTVTWVSYGKERNIVCIQTRGGKRIAVPDEIRLILLQRMHDGYGHPGKHKTAWLITPHYWWPNMYKEIQRYMDSCTTCQLSKTSHQPRPG